ncbi:hypothetical protein F4777DRAFT_570905 [Nemania sp. FL0916]|nr:hypothetical protein F4777DRAFT_570905 [Nemania sp. FL0916]
MKTTGAFLTSVFASIAMGVPLELETRDAVNVAFGQQIQTFNEANYWVVWVEGQDACPNIQSLGPLTDTPCDISFSLPGGTEQLHLSDCDGNNMPHSLYLSSGSFVRTCSASSDKITCHDAEHDIVKHGFCNA